ncbi:MAG: HAD-IIB family hydrolase [Pseudomonadota bacterium]
MNFAYPGYRPPPFFLVFTDLDGTLLDHNTYRWEAAIPALDLCRTKGVPIILASSKTRAEMDVLRRRLCISAPFISENGGGIFFPKETLKDLGPGLTPAGIQVPSQEALEGSSVGREKDLWEVPLGVPYAVLVNALGEIRDELGWNIKGFSDMGMEEISRLTGLDKAGARLAALREYDEPFIIEGEEPLDIAPLNRAAEKRGLLITSGGRFYHIQGKNDKANGMQQVAAWYKRHHEEVLTIALGDSPNDFGMLARADFPVLIRSGRTFPDLKKRIPKLRITQDVGPKGWNSAILRILGKNLGGS